MNIEKKDIYFRMGKVLQIVFIAMALLAFGIFTANAASTPGVKQRCKNERTSCNTRKQDRKIKRACKILAQRRYAEYRKALAAMNRRPKPRAEVDNI